MLKGLFQDSTDFQIPQISKHFRLCSKSIAEIALPGEKKKE